MFIYEPLGVLLLKPSIEREAGAMTFCIIEWPKVLLLASGI